MEAVTRVAAEAEMAVGLSGGPPITFMEAFLEGSREVVLDPHPNKTMDGVAWEEAEMVTWAPPEMQDAEVLTMMARAGPAVIGQDLMT